MTWTFSAYRSTMPQTWRGSTSHMDSSWTGGLSRSFLAASFPCGEIVTYCRVQAKKLARRDSKMFGDCVVTKPGTDSQRAK